MEKWEISEIFRQGRSSGLWLYRLQAEIHPVLLFMSFKQRFGTGPTFKYGKYSAAASSSPCLVFEDSCSGVCCPRRNRSKATALHERLEVFLNLWQTLIRDWAWPRLQPAFGGAAALSPWWSLSRRPRGLLQPTRPPGHPDPFHVDSQVSCRVPWMRPQPPDTKTERIEGCRHVCVIFCCYFC